MRFLYYIIHSFTECPDEDLEWFKDKKATCKKCGRVYFNFQV
jgi:uncharacterized OB-fold protein